MLPLGYFLLAWLVLLGFYVLLVLLTLLQVVRHGLPTPSSYASTFVFIVVIIAVVVGCGLYFLGIDWTTTIDLFPEGLNMFFFGSGQNISL